MFVWLSAILTLPSPALQKKENKWNGKVNVLPFRIPGASEDVGIIGRFDFYATEMRILSDGNLQSVESTVANGSRSNMKYGAIPRAGKGRGIS